MGLFGFSSAFGGAPALAGGSSEPDAAYSWASPFASAPQRQIPIGQSRPPRLASSGRGAPRVSNNQNLSNPTSGKPVSSYPASPAGLNAPTSLYTSGNPWGAPGYSHLQPSLSSKVAAPPVASDDHLYHTGIRPFDAGLNFMSGVGGAEWQTLKGTGDFLYNNNPVGTVVGLADATGMVRNVPAYMPDQRRTLQPVVDLGQALATHPGQVWRDATQAAGNWWDNLTQTDPDKRAYAWGGTAFNGLMAADGVTGAAGLVSKIGSIGRGVEALDALKAARAAEAAAPNVDDYVAGLRSKATPISSNAGRFEVEQTGSRNYRAVGGGKAVDIDGYSGLAIHEAKYVGNALRSPYVIGSDVPDFVRAKVLRKQHNQFLRFGAVISDPTVPFTALHVLTNESKAVPYFQNLMSSYKIPGKVVVIPTKVPGGQGN